ncbi:MAG: prepilin-type N-terminal cleavage/methylation domain-containing protein [Ruminococcaceae bacterium]|nr:prepilin-type N-terminal cleavage/methylation domain-containing protein [Oscillospiraceae bacterium]
MKKMNKKGFTIVELVVVIAVIAILAAIMIPTFSGVTTDAKEKADLANAQAEYNSYIAADANHVEDDFIIKSDINYYAVIDGKFDAEKSYASLAEAKAAFGDCVKLGTAVNNITEVTVYADHAYADNAVAGDACTNGCGATKQ